MRRFWTIIETYSAGSGNANRDLSDRGIEFYHAKYRAPRQFGVRRVLSLFTGYVFVRATMQFMPSLYQVKEVKTVFGTSPRISKRTQRFVELLRECEDDIGYVDEDRLMHHRSEIEKFMPGQIVRGLYGLFGGQSGKFVEYEGDYAKVRFSIFGGRELVAHVDAHELVGV